MKSKKKRIVIIDSGINIEHPNLKGLCVSGHSMVEGDATDDINDDLGHGTAILGIISSYNRNAEFYVIKLFDRKHNYVDQNILVSALNYIADKIPCDIVNLSLGISIAENKDELYRACKQLTEKGIIIVSAHDNLGSLSYPACFDNVIGVADSDNRLKNNEIEYVHDSTINILANGSNQRICWVEPNYLLSAGSSFACAHVSGILIACEQKFSSLNQAYSFLRETAKREIDDVNQNFEQKVYLPDGILGRIALFPFNKEMHSLIRFQDLMVCEITKVYDLRISGRVGATTNRVLGIESTRNFTIENIDNLDLTCFDMIIIGHLGETIDITGHNIQEEIISKCLQSNKRVYCFDDLPRFYNAQNFFHPKLEKRNVWHYPLGRLYRTIRPVIGVFGTSSRQGKFTLQLYLRRKFMQNGYGVGQIGTEPTAPLFGMDSCFHYGYHTRNQIQRADVVQYINSCYKALEEKDIIIVGGQSSIISPDNGNVSHFAFPQYEFFMACAPDAVILCVNTFDSQETIQRAIQFVEAAAFGKVIALVVFPLKRVNTQSTQLKRLAEFEYSNIRSQYAEMYGYPAYILGNSEDMDSLYQDCINYFEGEEGLND